jgi:HPr kinase/phosphorylase
MSADGSSIHGTAFLIGETGLIVLGRSGAGKSMLVAGLAASWLGPSIRLVADDRVKLTVAGGRLIARPVAGFLGKIELRGFGMALLPAMPSAVIRAMVRLCPAEPARMPAQSIESKAIFGIDVPTLSLLEGPECTARFLTKWPHFRSMI